MLQRLPITLTYVRAGNISENFLNEICQIIYSLFQAREVTKKVYNNIMNSSKVQYKLHTTFMNSKNTKRLIDYYSIVGTK